MSTSVNQGTNRTIFSDGCGLTTTDLNAIGSNATKRAWEEPMHGNLLSLDMVAGGYDSTFAGTSTALQSGVFTVNGGLVASASGLVSSLGAGHAGVWDETRLSPPNASDAAPRMSWVWTYQDWVHTHAAASSGNTRYDLVHCAIVKSNLYTTRDFKDATTGAKTSETMVTAEQLALDIQVTSGTQSSGTPTMPSLPSGRHALYAVLVGSASVVDVLDFTVPLGPMRQELVPASKMFRQSQFEASPGGSLRSYANPTDTQWYSTPSRNGTERILGLYLCASLPSTATIQLMGVTFDGVTTATNVLADLTSLVAPNGTHQRTFVDLRGLPSPTGIGPIWANGLHAKVNNSRSATVALFITLPGPVSDSAASIYSCEWYSVG